MKVMVVPTQVLLADDPMLMDGVTVVFTIIVTLLLVAVAAVTQPALEVSTQVMISLFAKPFEVNVGLLVPTFVPFIFH